MSHIPTRPARLARRCLLAGLAATALAVPATSLGAPGWQAPVYPRVPEAGIPPLTGSLTLAAGTGGRASLLYGGDDGAVWTVSRASARARWTPARRWRADARVSDTSPIAAVLGTRLTALWTTRRGGLAAATGGLASGGRPVTIRSGGRVAWPSLSLTPAGLAYTFTAGRFSPAAFGGLSPTATPLRGAARIDATSSRRVVQSGADSAGNMTAAWIGPGGQVQVATKPASATGWSPATTLPGSTGGAFALAVAPNGAAAVVYAANTVLSPDPSGSGTYLARAELLLVQRLPGETAFGASQVAGVFTQDPPGAEGVEYVGPWPSAATVAVNDSTVVLGFVAEGSVEDPVGFYVSRAALGAPLPPPTRLTNPRVRGLSEVTTWELWGVDMAIDRDGTAALAAGGNATQAVTDSLFATTSTATSPGWTRMTDIARCDSRAVGGTGIQAVDLAASPSGGLIAAWVCGRDAGATIGLATFGARR